mmetsp:Transcript_25499/g.38069  ORF Transcript_25499/g.38069 Transcript_25499/m.38069 type:complete len:328 (-) Transcript_25499:151-1134(-)
MRARPLPSSSLLTNDHARCLDLFLAAIFCLLAHRTNEPSLCTLLYHTISYNPFKTTTTLYQSNRHSPCVVRNCLWHINTGSNRCKAGELQGGGVQYPYNITSSWGLEYTDERTQVSILRVYINSVLGGIGTLHELNLGIQWTSVGLHYNPDALHSGVQVVRTHTASSLHKLLGAHFVDSVGEGDKTSISSRCGLGTNSTHTGELNGVFIANEHGRTGSGGLNPHLKGTKTTLTTVNLHLLWGVIGALVELDIDLERVSLRGALSGHCDVHALDLGVRVGPRLQRSSLHANCGLEGIPGSEPRFPRALTHHHIVIGEGGTSSSDVGVR